MGNMCLELRTLGTYRSIDITYTITFLRYQGDCPGQQNLTVNILELPGIVRK